MGMVDDEGKGYESSSDRHGGRESSFGGKYGGGGYRGSESFPNGSTGNDVNRQPTKVSTAVDEGVDEEQRDVKGWLSGIFSDAKEVIDKVLDFVGIVDYEEVSLADKGLKSVSRALGVGEVITSDNPLEAFQGLLEQEGIDRIASRTLGMYAAPAMMGLEGIAGIANVIDEYLSPAADTVAQHRELQEAISKAPDDRTGYEQSLVDFENARQEAIHDAMEQINPSWVDPIILDLGGNGLDLISLSSSAAFNDFDSDDYLENLGWVSGDDGILSIDLNGSGTIDDASEFVFAGETEAEDTDLEALAELYDSNGDGVLNAEDEAWEDFRVWQDWNGDGQSQEGEVSTLAELNITEVGLVSDGVEEEIAGNTVHGRATFTREDGTTGDVGDVSFKASSYGYRETEDGIEIGDGNTLIVEGDDDQNRDLADTDYDGLITGAGDDTLSNSSGEDGYLSSGAGNDTLVGGDGDEWLSGGDGADTIIAGGGHDILFVDGDDTIDGGDGFDVVLGQGDGDLSIDLGATNTEAVYGAQGNDDLWAGDAQHVTMDGGAGDDQITGGEGNDLLSGGDGADTLRGGAGDDTLVVDENDDFNGGAGEDRVIFMGDADLDINITNYEVEIFNSGGGDDVIRTDQTHEAAIDGGEGDDTVFGGWGDDWLSGGHGDDSLLGGYGDDTYIFGRGDGSDTVRDFSHNTRTDTIYDLYSDGSKRNVRYRTVDIHEDAGNDTILFGADINPDDLMIKADGQDIIIALKDPDNPDATFDELSDQLRLVNWQDARDRIEGIEFSNGTSLDLNAMLGNLGFAADGTVLDVGAAMTAKLGELAGAVGEDGVGLAGSSADEILSGGDGDDVIAAGGGDDLLTGAEGDDQLYGQDGDDVLHGGEGSDLLDGGAGDDILLSDGNDTLRGGAGTDTVKFSSDEGVQLDLSDAGVESVLGSLGDDELSALGLEDAIYINGGSGDDTLTSGSGDDSLLGGSGDDVLDGGAGDDVLDGGSGNDTFIGNDGVDHLTGGDGEDVVDYSGGDEGVDLSLENGGTGGDAAGDSFDGVENVIGTDHDDVISGNATDNTVDAGVGDDSLSGKEGDDLLLGGSGDDVLDGGDGADTLEGGVGDDTLSGGTGQDTINAGAGDDRIVARGDGDIIDGGDGSDTLDYSDADEGVRLDMSDTTGYQAGSVEDRAENIEQVAGSSADDDLAAGSGNDQMAGGLGDDVLTGRLGDDILDGGSGDDTILGQQGDDTLSGGDGNDIISGGSGDDILFGGSGDDLIFGGEGDDTVVFAGSRDDYLLTRDGDDLVVAGENGTTRIEDAETIRFDDGDFAVEDLLDDDDLPSVTDTTRQRRDEMSQTSFAASVAAAAALGGLASSYDNTAQAAEVIQAAADQASAEGDNIWLVAPLADNGGTDGSDNISGASGDDMLAANGDVTADVASAFAKSDQLDAILSELGAAAQSGSDAPIARVLSEDEMQAALAADALDDESANGGVSDSVSGSDESDDTASSDATETQDDASESGENSGADDNGIAFFNAPPTAVDDYVFSLEDQEIRVALSDLLGNDRDRENNVLRLDGIISASHGTVSVRDGYMTFVPDADYNGRAEVRYWIHDGYGNRVESVLNIDLSPVNDTPEISVQSTRTHYDTAVDLTSLVTASDRDGDAVYVDLRDASGLGYFEVDGVAIGDDTTVRVLASELDRVRYIPSQNLNTAETLIARTFDGELYSAWETFEITADNTRLGSEGDDILQAGGLGDILDGFAGDDTLTGGAANDLLLGRAGEDTLDGGDGDDTLYGGEGNDTLIGGSGDNTLFGGDGDDTLEIVNVDDLDRMFAGSGRDRLIIHNVDDLTLDLSAYDLEEIIAGSGDDYLYSSDNSDLYIDAGAGDDVLQGGDGNDTLIGGDGKDRIDGGAGDDVIEVGLGDNLADIDGGSGNDTLTVSDGVDMTIDMTGINIENVVGGAGAETVTDLFATGSHVSLGAGDDTVVSGAGADVLEGGEGSDTLDYSQSTSSVNVDLASSLVSGGHADGDTISGFEHVNDTTFDDVIVGSAKNNRLYSSSGNDALTGGAGADTFAVNIAAGATGTVRVRDFTPSKGDMFSLAGVGGATLIAAATNALANQTMDEDGNVSVIFDNGREVIFEGLGKPLSADMMDAPVVVASETISDEQTGEMTVAVQLSKPVDEDVVFDFSLTDGSGSVASDLLASTGAITVSAGDTNGSTKIGANADTAIEGTETFNVKVDQVASGGEAAVALEDVTGTAYLIDQQNTDNQIEQSLYGVDETQLKQTYIEGGDTSIGVLMSGYIDTNHPVYFNRVVASVNSEMEAGGASFVDFDYSFYIANNYHWTNGAFYSYYRFQGEDGQWSDWSSSSTIRSYGGDWQSINFSGNYRINFAEELPDDALLQVRVGYYHGVVSGRGSYQLGGGLLDIGTMHTEVLVSNELFDVGDINGDGRTDVAYFDYDAGQYVFRYGEIGATTSEAFNLENDTSDAIVGVVGGAGNNAENVSFVAAGAKLYTLNIPADGETINLSDQPHLTTSEQIKSISLSKIDDAQGKTLLIGLGDENGLSSILRVSPSNTLSQTDIDNAPRIELAAGYTDIVDLGDIDGDGLADIGLQSENGVVRLPRSVFDNDNALVQIGSSGEELFVSSADDEVFVGMAGDDTYSFSGSLGHDIIDNTSSNAFEDDSILFNADISPEQLWFSQSGDDLLIEVLGGDQSINVVDWYGKDTTAKLDHISFADGRDLVSHEVEQLVSIMAGVSRTGDEELVTDALSQAQVEEEVEQLWSA